MRKKGYKGRCEKKDLSKSQEVCRTYDAIQSNYADILQNDNDIQEIRCNVLLDGLSEGHKIGLDYVSCSPFRVPIARLAAAQAAINEK